MDFGGKASRKNWRILLWLLLLFGVVLYALGELERRERGRDWTQPVRVAVVLVLDRDQPPTPAAIARFEERTLDLSARLEEERLRYAPDATPPFQFSVHTTEEPDRPRPRLTRTGLWSTIRYNFDLWRYASAVDDRANIETDHDIRIYVRARTPDSAERQMVEGASQHGGNLGLVDVDLDESSVDFGLFVVAHELFHTCGAEDKYDARGLALVPEGLAEPELRPPFPQRYAEVMARGRPLAPGVETPPTELGDLRVGHQTAGEIGWLTSARGLALGDPAP